MITGIVGKNTTQLTLRIWHPDCWTLRCTSAVDAGLIAHGVYQIDDRVSARITAYADSNEKIEELVSVIDDSPLTDSVQIVNEYFDPNLQTGTAGNATEELLVEYESKNSIHDAFVSRGFVPDEEIRIQGGNEYWTVIISENRGAIQDRLDEVRDEMAAEITVEEIRSPAGVASDGGCGSRLSERQREIFKLAQRRGYYSWPREISASEIAAELDISKTTLLEHLRKAESKLLGPE
jgi:predicted DNA binding protein